MQYFSSKVRAFKSRCIAQTRAYTLTSLCLAGSWVGVWFQLVFQAAAGYIYCQCVCVPVCDTRSCASVCQRDALTRSPDFRSTRWEKREMGCNRAQDAGQTKHWFSDASPCLTELLYQTQYRHSYLNRHKHLWNKTDAGRVNIRVTSLITSLHQMAVHEHMTEKGDRFNND